MYVTAAQGVEITSKGIESRVINSRRPTVINNHVEVALFQPSELYVVGANPLTVLHEVFTESENGINLSHYDFSVDTYIDSKAIESLGVTARIRTRFDGLLNLVSLALICSQKSNVVELVTPPEGFLFKDSQQVEIYGRAETVVVQYATGVNAIKTFADELLQRFKEDTVIIATRLSINNGHVFKPLWSPQTRIDKRRKGIFFPNDFFNLEAKRTFLEMMPFTNLTITDYFKILQTVGNKKLGPHQFYDRLHNEQNREQTQRKNGIEIEYRGGWFREAAFLISMYLLEQNSGFQLVTQRTIQ